MPETPGGPALLFALDYAAVIFKDMLLAHAVEEGDEAEGEFVFEIEAETEGKMLGELRIIELRKKK